ncbi:MAG TPA: acyltransferase [Alphaproteobacteria bacterium]|nr:acyltransferase [Alphaproteobacteria bacterium]
MIEDEMRAAIERLQDEKKQQHRRHVSVGDLLTDRWETARRYGWGEGASCYDNVLVIGEVRVGRNTWIGPNVILDGSGGLEIGDYCSISAGAQIYSHHTVKWSLSLGKDAIETAPTKIGSGVYIGPNAVIQMGVTIGDRVVIGALSFVNRDIPSGSKAFGQPARIIAASDPATSGIGADE